MEVGCGDGNFLAYLSKHGWAVSGIEFSPENVDTVLRKHGITVLQGEFSDQPIPSESLQVIGSYQVIEHVYNPPKTVEAMWRTLEPGGTLHIQTPNIDGIESRLTKQFAFALGAPLHSYLFGKKSLCLLLAKSGFQIREVRTYDPYHSPACTAFTIRSVAARLLAGKQPTPVPPRLPTSGSSDDNGAVRTRSPQRRAAEWVLRQNASVITRLESFAGTGNMIDVVATKPLSSP